jgi:predicted HicB family RNase H-like nuclease
MDTTKTQPEPNQDDSDLVATTIRVPKQLHESFVALAKREHRSFNGQVCKALTDAVVDSALEEVA